MENVCDSPTVAGPRPALMVSTLAWSLALTASTPSTLSTLAPRARLAGAMTAGDPGRYTPGVHDVPPPIEPVLPPPPPPPPPEQASTVRTSTAPAAACSSDTGRLSPLCVMCLLPIQTIAKTRHPGSSHIMTLGRYPQCPPDTHFRAAPAPRCGPRQPGAQT